MKRIQWSALAGAAALLCGCSELPAFDTPVDPEKVAPRVSDMINEVQCEILLAVDDSRSKPELADLQNGQYVANVNLTLDVTDNQGINPALSFISPFATAGTSFAVGLNAQLSGQQHRNFNVTFTLLFDKNTGTEANLKACRQPTSQYGLRGNLGIADVLGTGLRYETDSPYQNEYPYKIPAISVGTSLTTDPLTSGAALAPNFGSQIDFMLVYGLGGGPGWTLTHFTGPNAGTGLLTFLRTNKDTLILSFGRVAPPSATPAAAAASVVTPAVQAAGTAAQANVTRIILQGILPR